MANSLAIESCADGTQGKDPRKMSVDDLHKLGHVQKPLMRVIKEKCNDCVGADPSGIRHSEVAKCQCTGCPLWAYRMGKNPFSTRGEMSEERKAEVRERFAKARESRAL